MIELRDVQAAYERIRGRIYVSPCAKSETFSRRCGAITYFKLENLQMTGSFKERGALNKLLSLDPEERARGVITASAGNHAQGVAYHAAELAIPTTVVMPKRTPLIKVTNTRQLGAQVILEGESFDDAQDIARRLQAERGLSFVHPFDDDLVLAGQGTIALELMEQEPGLEVVIVPIGGGGLISGIATAYKALRPAVQIIGVEAQAQACMRKSLDLGRVADLESGEIAATIADGIAVKHPVERTFACIKRYVDDVVTVDEEEIANAILLLVEQEKTVAEGAGATPLAALFNGKVPGAAGKKTAMVLSGGNIDVNLLSRIIERGLAKDGRLIRLEIEIRDQPGALAQLLRLIAEAQGNVLEVHHDRAFSGVSLGQVDVELTLETRGQDHAGTLIHYLEERGFRVRELDSPRRRGG